MSADYAALEARVADLEQQIRHVLPYKIDAVSYGLGIMHAELRERLDHQGQRLDRIELHLSDHVERIGAIGRRLDAQGEMLAEILRRLPSGPINGPSGGRNDH